MTFEPKRFDTVALYAALDAERDRRGVSWSAVAKQMGVSVSTFKNTAKGGVMEADGIIDMLQWLGLPAATFLPGDDSPTDLVAQVDTLLQARKDLSPDAASEPGYVVRSSYERLRTAKAARSVDGNPSVPPGDRIGYKRLDTGGLYAVLDAQRDARGMSWQQVADEIGEPLINASTLSRLAQGGRTGVPRVMHMLQWVGLPAEVFLRRLAPPEFRNEAELPPPDLMAQVGVLLRARDDLSAENATELEGIIRTAYERLRSTAS